ncbi:unnamed protein product, partial [Heterotrigona itama]
ILEKWESLTARVEETQMATALHRELTALRTEFKAAHDRLFSYEIALEQPHILDERINRITRCSAKAAYIGMVGCDTKMLRDQVTAKIRDTKEHWMFDLFSDFI